MYETDPEDYQRYGDGDEPVKVQREEDEDPYNEVARENSEAVEARNRENE
jgi:hypothetical protein